MLFIMLTYLLASLTHVFQRRCERETWGAEAAKWEISHSLASVASNCVPSFIRHLYVIYTPRHLIKCRIRLCFLALSSSSSLLSPRLHELYLKAGWTILRNQQEYARFFKMIQLEKKTAQCCQLLSNESSTSSKSQGSLRKIWVS